MSFSDKLFKFLDPVGSFAEKIAPDWLKPFSGLTGTMHALQGNNAEPAATPAAATPVAAAPPAAVAAPIIAAQRRAVMTGDEEPGKLNRRRAKLGDN